MLLPPWFQIVELPPCPPATKPKALAAALWIAKGELVTVFDAEDSPASDQLKRAAERLMADPRLGCVQARLVIDNADGSWLARQLALEYAAQFSGLLPLLTRLDAPVLLGGTSNHFRRSTLMKIGGWDPYNVTEDADLGLRLARFGYSVGTLPSETCEEAPRRLAPWLRQRTRWMKGWMQTWCVHMRDPVRLFRDLGFRRFVYVQLLLTGSLACALIHPLFYVVLAADLWSGVLPGSGTEGITATLAWVGAVNFVLGYLVAALSMLCFAPTAKAKPTLLSIIGIPIYWLLISAATWRAAWKLVSEPFTWEKTPHSARPPIHDPERARP
jgi:cellulose synthase/poly-beta-1,6-N-acetylglucosamine synthase-like glycosyltransferase